MIKRSILAMILVVVVLLALSVAVAYAQDATPTPGAATTTTTAVEEDLQRLIVRNNSDNFLSIMLTSADGNRTYVLWTPAGDERVFTVPDGTYNRTTFACNESNTGSLDLTRQTRLVFNSCFGDPPNWGEPSMEKITVGGDGPENNAFQYGYD